MSQKNFDKITLVNSDGTSTEYYDIAGIRYKGSYFSILQPVILPSGMSDTDVLVFRVTKDKDGTNTFALEDNDKVVDGVMKKFGRLIRKSNQEYLFGNRAVGHPVNMLLDLGVFVVLGFLATLGEYFAGGEMLQMVCLLGFMANICYTLIHLGAFIIGKR